MRHEDWRSEDRDYAKEEELKSGRWVESEGLTGKKKNKNTRRKGCKE